MTLDPEAHRKLAIEANNTAADLVRMPLDEISDEDKETMTRLAYVAAYHWSRAAGATIANEARAEWVLSRAWAVRGDGALALRYAQRSRDACARGGLADFDLAYAHEALARANACLGNGTVAREHQEVARGVPIEETEDGSYFLEDFLAEPWCGFNPQ